MSIGVILGPVDTLVPYLCSAQQIKLKVMVQKVKVMSGPELAPSCGLHSTHFCQSVCAEYSVPPEMGK